VREREYPDRPAPFARGHGSPRSRPGDPIPVIASAAVKMPPHKAERLSRWSRITRAGTKRPVAGAWCCGPAEEEPVERPLDVEGAVNVLQADCALAPPPRRGTLKASTHPTYVRRENGEQGRPPLVQ
jgi:hypothetical protein